MDFVDTKYWTDVYEENQAESICFKYVLIPEVLGSERDVKLADKNEEGSYISTRDNAQVYVLWDKDYLYVLFDVNDTDISPERGYYGDFSYYSQTDSVGLFLSESDNYNGIAVFADAINNAFSTDEYGTGMYDYIAHATNVKADSSGNILGYQAEYIILFNSEHGAGHVIGMDFCVMDCYSVSQYITSELKLMLVPQRAAVLNAFVPIIASYTGTPYYGKFELGGEGAVEIEDTE